MLKKFLAAVTAAVLAVSMSGCSEYKMTEEDLELQKSMVGYWAADDSTGYNEYDENGYITMMMAVQFTDDFNYLVYECYLNENYVLTYEPTSYTIENGKFRVEKNNQASYAGISISADGTTMSWINNDKTDKYLKFSLEKAQQLGIPEYDPNTWIETESDSDAPENAGEDTAADTEEQTADTEE